MPTTLPKKRGRPPKQTTPIPSQPLEHATPTDGGYTLELRLSGEVFTSSAPTVIEALKLLEHPAKIVTKGTITVRHGDKEKSIFLMPLAMKRLFYPLAQVATAKMLGMNM